MDNLAISEDICIKSIFESPLGEDSDIYQNHNISHISQTGKPSPPQDLKVVSVDNKKAVIRWNPPQSTGGSPITGYAVEKKDLGSRSADWTSATSTSDTSVTITRLTEGHQYLFRVFAENENGASEPAVTKQPATAKLPYSKFN